MGVVLALPFVLPALMAPRAHRGTVTIGGHSLDVAVADTDALRSFGLQGRASLPDGTGMVFVYDSPRAVTFARKSVPFPIDVVFVGPDRTVTGVAPIDAGHGSAASPGIVGWVVEVPGGWAARNGVETGSPFSLPR